MEKGPGTCQKTRGRGACAREVVQVLLGGLVVVVQALAVLQAGLVVSPARTCK